MKEGGRLAGVEGSSHHRIGGKRKGSTKLIERLAKHPDGWDLVKELSQIMADV
jgi:hypothetical protein